MDSPLQPSPFRAGLAVLVGRTNVGKSTLTNALVGQKITIVTPKPQTTRHVVHGIVQDPAFQLVLVDTPGFFKTRTSRLVSELHRKAREALEGIDLIVHVVDPSREIGEEDQMVEDVLRPIRQSRILCLNKSDLSRKTSRDAWRARAQTYAGMVEVSARSGAGLPELRQLLAELLPVHPPLYPPEEVSNMHRDFQIAELIREQVYKLTNQEVPYRTVIELDAVEEAVTNEGKPFL
ncbi:MAG: GTPase Era, partial [Verrucomicrobiota bacterium]